MKQVPPPKSANGEMLPLMDMIFLLLVIFIFMIIQMRPNFGIEVTLPDVGKTELAKQDQKKVKNITISVTSQNKVYFDAKEITTNSLTQEINKLKSATGKEKIKIILRGDKKADYGKIIELFNTLRTAGLKDVLFDVESGK